MTAVSLHAAAIADRRVERRVVVARRGDDDIALLSSPQAASMVAEWRELARRGADDNVFFHPGMLLPAIDHLDFGIRVATVRDPVSPAVSAIRTKSPPMLLGRKLLKKLATTQVTVRCHVETCTRCVTSSRRQRQPLTSNRTPCTSRASRIHAGST